jgi:hypothetical protein
MKQLDAALKRGSDELMNLCEYALRDKPRALARARERYRALCLYLFRALERARRC